MKQELKEANEKLQARIDEIKAMSNKQLVWAMCTQAGWEYTARREAKHELADNLYKDLELLKYEVLGRMRIEVEPRQYDRDSIVTMLGIEK